MPAPITLDMIRQSLYSAVVCDALDSIGLRNQSPRCRFERVGADGVLVGRCKTTLWSDMFHEVSNPYELELRAVDSCAADDIFVAAAGGSLRSAVWGELLSTAARNRGCVGALIDGGVRDQRKIGQMGFPVFARAALPYDSQNRQRVVDIDVAVEVEGVVFSPGDLVIADCDGVVVVPAACETEVIRRAWDKAHAENAVREAIGGGMKATDAYEKFRVL